MWRGNSSSYYNIWSLSVPVCFSPLFTMPLLHFLFPAELPSGLHCTLCCVQCRLTPCLIMLHVTLLMIICICCMPRPRPKSKKGATLSPFIFWVVRLVRATRVDPITMKKERERGGAWRENLGTNVLVPTCENPQCDVDDDSSQRSW